MPAPTTQNHLQRCSPQQLWLHGETQPFWASRFAYRRWNLANSHGSLAYGIHNLDFFTGPVQTTLLHTHAQLIFWKAVHCGKRTANLATVLGEKSAQGLFWCFARACPNPLMDGKNCERLTFDITVSLLVLCLWPKIPKLIAKPEPPSANAITKLDPSTYINLPCVWNISKNRSLGIQSRCQMMIGVYNHQLRKVFRFYATILRRWLDPKNRSSTPKCPNYAKTASRCTMTFHLHCRSTTPSDRVPDARGSFEAVPEQPWATRNPCCWNLYRTGGFHQKKGTQQKCPNIESPKGIKKVASASKDVDVGEKLQGHRYSIFTGLRKKTSV